MSLRIIKAGLLDTIQDGGRYGCAHAGIPPSGPMDPFSAGLANSILGKELTAPVIEIHFPSPVIELTESCIIAVTGAGFTAVIDGMELPLCQPVLVNKNALIEFIKPVSGMRAYIGVYPGMQLQPWLESCSTNLQIKSGGLIFRALRKGDEIESEHGEEIGEGPRILPWNSRQQLAKGSIKVLQGPEWPYLAENFQQEFLTAPFLITPGSDRMGIRLKGPLLQTRKNEEMLSSAVSAGTIQLFPDGNPVVLMADHPTTGGYPRIASVIRAHLGVLAQLTPGSAVHFSMVDIEQAEQLFLAQNRYLQELKALSGAEMTAFLKR